MTGPAHRADVFLDPADDPREGGVTLGFTRLWLGYFDLYEPGAGPQGIATML